MRRHAILHRLSGSGAQDEEHHDDEYGERAVAQPEGQQPVPGQRPVWNTAARRRNHGRGGEQREWPTQRGRPDPVGSSKYTASASKTNWLTTAHRRDEHDPRQVVQQHDQLGLRSVRNATRPKTLDSAKMVAPLTTAVR